MKVVSVRTELDLEFTLDKAVFRKLEQSCLYRQPVVETKKVIRRTTHTEDGFMNDITVHDDGRYTVWFRGSKVAERCEAVKKLV